MAGFGMEDATAAGELHARVHTLTRQIEREQEAADSSWRDVEEARATIVELERLRAEYTAIIAAVKA